MNDPTLTEALADLGLRVAKSRNARDLVVLDDEGCVVERASDIREVWKTVHRRRTRDLPPEPQEPSMPRNDYESEAER